MKKLDFPVIEVESNIQDLLDEIIKIRKSGSLNLTHHKKFDRWIEELKIILTKISSIKKDVLPLIKKDLGYSFKNSNLVVTAMLQPSIKNIFIEIKIHLKSEPIPEISDNILDKIEAGPDNAKSLAWIGDTAIKYAILMRIWQPGITPEKLHNSRESIENNQNLSILCDKWKLFEHRILLDNGKPEEEKINKIKGTLVEAIFGIIFVEKGIKKVQAAMYLIAR